MHKAVLITEPQSFWRWVTTPPQSYAVSDALSLVVSFYVGTLEPKKAKDWTAAGTAPQRQAF